MTSLGKYELHEQLGKGGFGTVYRATDNIGRTVAVKVLKPGFLDDPDVLARFKREALAAGSLFHPHIATILELDEVDGRVFIVMRYIDGKSLETILKERGRLPLDEAFSIFKQIGEALQFAHGKGFIHRDLKPGNIIISPIEGAVLTDFGLVKSASASGMSTTGVMLGTPAYIAPEIWRGKPATPASDIYSMGCILHEMLTGRVLFEGDSPADVMTKHVLDGPQLDESLPQEIRSLFLKALNREPEKRFTSMDEFILALNKIAEPQKAEPEKKAEKTEKETIPPTPPLSPVSPYPTPDDSGLSKDARKIITGVAIGFIALVGIIVVILRASNGRPTPVVPTSTAVAVVATEAAAPAATEAQEDVTIEWLVRGSSSDPLLSSWQKLADDYHIRHPNVTIEITSTDYSSYALMLSTRFAAGDAPDIFLSYGGDTFESEVASGQVKDITADLNANGGEWRSSFMAAPLSAFSKDGKNYGVPYDMGMLGWWYNKDLFARAGIENPPATWNEFLTDVQKLQAAGITPIAIDGSDGWMDSSIWYSLAMRIGGQEELTAALNRTGSFSDPAFIRAGTELKRLIDMQPFQKNFQNAVHADMQESFASGEVAMEFSGQWSTAFFNGGNFGFFNFPTVEGGNGDASDVVGSVDGFMLSSDAPQAAVDFVKDLTSVEAQEYLVSSSVISLPAVKGADSALTDAYLPAFYQDLANADHFQLYYNMALPSDLTSIVHTAVGKLFTGSASPEDVAAEIEAVAQQTIK